MADKWFLIFFFATLPCQWALFSGATVDVPLVRVMAIGIVLYWFAKSLFCRHVVLPRPLTLFFFMSFLIWAATSLWWTLDMAATVRKVIFLVNFFFLFFVFIDWLQPKRVRESVIQATLIGGFVAALVGIVQFLSQFLFSVEQIFRFQLKILPFFLGTHFGEAVSKYPSLLVNIGGETFMRATGFFPDPHMFSYYLLLLLPLAWYWAKKEQHFFWQLVPVALLFGTLLSFSRSAYAALFCGVGIAVIIALKKSQVWQPKILFIGTMVILILTQSPAFSRALSSFSTSDGSVQERLRLWQEAGSTFLDHPVAGVGLGSYPIFVKPTAAPREPIYVHSLYLDIVVELGLVGLITFLGFLGSVLPFKKKTENPLYQSVLQYTIILFLVQSLFETPLFSVHVLPLFILITSLLYVQKNIKAE
jgi:O-antigen ligase